MIVEHAARIILLKSGGVVIRLHSDPNPMEPIMLSHSILCSDCASHLKDAIRLIHKEPNT